MAQLHLKIVSQEKELVSDDALSVSVPTTEGELTILPKHVPLFVGLEAGLVRYTNAQQQEIVLVISKGFLNVDPNNTVIIMIDSAVAEREISPAQAQAAIDAAKQKIQESSANVEDLIRAEAELRYALLQLRVAQKHGKIQA
jgi:F-type H+-transporting ATPase subunit epsilon